MKVFQRGDKDEVLKLLPHMHHKLGSSGSELLHYAVQHGWADVCRTLIEQYNCNARETDQDGFSVLHSACLYGHPSVVKYLLTLKSVSATVSYTDRFGFSPVEQVKKNKYEIYSLFASHFPVDEELHVRAVFNIFIAGKNDVNDICFYNTQNKSHLNMKFVFRRGHCA